MSMTSLLLYVGIGDMAVATRLIRIRRDARPLPRPERKTVQLPVIPMSVLVYGNAEVN